MLYDTILYYTIILYYIYVYIYIILHYITLYYIILYYFISYPDGYPFKTISFFLLQKHNRFIPKAHRFARSSGDASAAKMSGDVSKLRKGDHLGRTRMMGRPLDVITQRNSGICFRGPQKTTELIQTYQKCVVFSWTVYRFCRWYLAHKSQLFIAFRTPVRRPIFPAYWPVQVRDFPGLLSG